MTVSRFHGRRAPRPPASRSVTLSDEWRLWIIDNALRGVVPATLVSTLVSGGVPLHLAHREVTATLASPAFAMARRLAERTRSLELVLRLRRTQDAAGPSAAEVDRLPTIDADTFYRHYFAAGRPLVLTAMTRDWPALGRWSFADLRARFGGAVIEVMADRDGHPNPDRHLDRHRQTVRLADYIDRIESAGESNDTYVVSHNKALQNPALRPLLDEVRPPDDLFDPSSLPRAVSLWIGPAGTRTPLHHDTTNIFFCQMWGRKRFWLISSFETALLDGAQGFYAAMSAEELEAGSRPELAGVRVQRVDLGPGDALFLPAGIWHQVLALEPSISFSLLGFRRPNDLSWYRPGG